MSENKTYFAHINGHPVPFPFSWWEEAVEHAAKELWARTEHRPWSRAPKMGKQWARSAAAAILAEGMDVGGPDNDLAPE